MSEPRTTAITEESDGITRIRGYAVTELLTTASFADAIFALLQGARPTPVQSKVFNAVLVAAIDHGPLAPSADVARRVASTGNPMQAAVGAGVTALGDWHGGAIEQAAELFSESMTDSSAQLEQRAEKMVAGGLEKFKRLPGYGHRLYTVDPRVEALFTFCRQQSMPTDYMDLAMAGQSSLAKVKGKAININIDGAMAAVLCQLEFTPALQRGVFIIARTPGLVAHAHEQLTQAPVLRSSEAVDYNGPGPRSWDPQT